MKSFKSILCASLLTLAVSSAALGRAGDITSKPGDITSKPGDITSKPGDITSLTDGAYDGLIEILNLILG